MFLLIVLSRVQSFLPVMKEADRELQKRLQSEPPEQLNIEAVADGEACIQMVPIIWINNTMYKRIFLWSAIH